MPPKTTYVVLGDIVNKGKNSIEVVCLLYCFKVLYPNKHFILRGEQESTDRVRKGGFKTEVKYRFDGDLYKKLVMLCSIHYVNSCGGMIVCDEMDVIKSSYLVSSMEMVDCEMKSNEELP